MLLTIGAAVGDGTVLVECWVLVEEEEVGVVQGVQLLSQVFESDPRDPFAMDTKKSEDEVA